MREASVFQFDLHGFSVFRLLPRCPCSPDRVPSCTRCPTHRGARFLGFAPTFVSLRTFRAHSRPVSPDSRTLSRTPLRDPKRSFSSCGSQRPLCAPELSASGCPVWPSVRRRLVPLCFPCVRCDPASQLRPAFPFSLRLRNPCACAPPALCVNPHSVARPQLPVSQLKLRLSAWLQPGLVLQMTAGFRLPLVLWNRFEPWPDTTVRCLAAV